ncbi:MAG: hypothetical protein KJO98_06690 [Rhodothermia bacterium]|nr:hypothetical protein [Rhodothermia bacterium]
MLRLHFTGWFQCRLATNPDPSDEPRGVSGYTFAVAGEPDLDRVIRFHEPVAPRSHGPEVGVYVRHVYFDGVEKADHCLVNARVDLRGDPKFESRNLLISEDRSGIGIIEPFDIHVVGDGVEISRKDLLYPPDETVPTHRVPAEFVARRAPSRKDGMTLDPNRIAEATGIVDPVRFRAEKAEALKLDLEAETDETSMAALQKRIRELRINDDATLRVLSLSLVQSWRFDLNGPATVNSKGADIDPVDTAAPWPIDFWMGGWDADSLCGFVSGTINIPLIEEPYRAQQD